MTKVCSRCRLDKDEGEFYLRNDKRKPRPYRDSMCKSCRLGIQRDRRRDDPDVHKAAVAAWKDANPERRREINRESRKRVNQRRRLAFIIEHGGKCECCGETDPHFLTVDHIGDRPAEHKGLGGLVLIDKIISTNYSREHWQILCWNCNCAKGRYGCCPHQQEFVPYYDVKAIAA